jgi:hypothetical protein
LEGTLKMSHYWNYRVVRHKAGIRALSSGKEIEYDDYYAIHEVHYNPDGSIYAMTREPVDVVSDGLKEIKSVLNMMRKACDKDTLDYDMEYADYQDEEL